VGSAIFSNPGADPSYRGPAPEVVDNFLVAVIAPPAWPPGCPCYLLIR